jgi:hypothetical protein
LARFFAEENHMSRTTPHSSRQKDRHTEGLKRALQYPLFEALRNRRSRRFSRGAKLPGGGLAYESALQPQPLGELEEALLVFAAAGITGLVVADLPFQEGTLREGGGGNVMASLVGRTGASADAVHSSSLFVINDNATYLVKRPQDFTLKEIHELVELAGSHRFEDLYSRMKVKIRDGRAAIPREVPSMFPFNKWSTNLAGSTYFLPVCELSGMYINVVLSAFDEQMALFVLDERNWFRPAGIKHFGKSRGGRLNDNPDGGRVVTVAALETTIADFMLAEQSFIAHNLSLMEQAIGLGGWTHFATATETAWYEALGFTLRQQKLSEFTNPGLIFKSLLRLTGQDRVFSHAVGFSHDGLDLIRPFCPPYYKSMKEAVHAFLELKRASVRRIDLGDEKQFWRDPDAVTATIPDFSEQCIDATVSYCSYIYETYGRFPAHFGPIRTTLAHQAHHLDLDFYDKFYDGGAYTDSQKHHEKHWGE